MVESSRSFPCCLCALPDRTCRVSACPGRAMEPEGGAAASPGQPAGGGCNPAVAPCLPQPHHLGTTLPQLLQSGWECVNSEGEQTQAGAGWACVAPGVLHELRSRAASTSSKDRLPRIVSTVKLTSIAGSQTPQRQYTAGGADSGILPFSNAAAAQAAAFGSSPAGAPPPGPPGAAAAGWPGAAAAAAPNAPNDEPGAAGVAPKAPKPPPACCCGGCCCLRKASVETISSAVRLHTLPAAEHLYLCPIPPSPSLPECPKATAAAGRLPPKATAKSSRSCRCWRPAKRRAPSSGLRRLAEWRAA